MSNDSASKPPSSAVSYGSHSDSYTSTSSSTSYLQRSSVDFYNSCSFGAVMRDSGSALWHPPMLPPENATNSPQFIYPSIMSPDESPHMYQSVLQHDDADSLFAMYLHPPMIRTEDLPPMDSLQLHPPMLPTEWKNLTVHTDYYNVHMATF